MFETFNPEGKMVEPCRPDPEEMLKRTYDRLDLLHKAEVLLSEFSTLPLYIHEREIDRAILLLFGMLKVRRLEAEKERDRWLDEVAKTEAKP